ncbi:hypothetical protein BD414DRAFT_91528 [Trametes punicea]|nr:hypothetical protein BD414DRAFT_91528 [Trametes punicea]
MFSTSPEEPTTPASSSSVPSWAPPRAPLPPHRLAKLANALGVSTPVPAIHAIHSPASSYAPSPILSNTATSSAFDFRRSPTPSVGSAHTYTPLTHTSKYLLHVIPPAHLPHGSDNLHDNGVLLPPPPSASGYHAQFRRGILVPVYPTLQSQLAAIAKEYALPSTVGLVLYLINSSPAAEASMRLGRMTDDHGDTPGPRLSEDIWRHIWVRVLKAERDEPPPSAVRSKGLGFGSPAAQSSPSLLQDVMSNQNSLRPLLSPMLAETPQLMTPSPSTTASHSAISSRSDLDSPESATSVSDGSHADGVPLPGLHSHALIPILAKVEFDIDRRKATWYDHWKRSRRVQHAKRAESRLGMQRRTASRMDDESGAEGEEEDLDKKPGVSLRLVNRLQATENTPAYLRPRNGRLLGPDADDDQYAPLPDSDEEGSSDEEGDAEATARYGQGSVRGDPLADVFGTDAETWADVRAENALQKRPRHSENPNFVDLALDGAALSALPDPADDDEERREETDDVAEVVDLLKRSSRPRLSVAIPSSPPQEPRRSSQGSGLSRKHVPPALNLASSLPGAANATALASDGSNLRLAYLQEENTPSTGDFGQQTGEPSDGEITHKPIRRSPLEEKREGVFYDDLDLGLESSYEVMPATRPFGMYSYSRLVQYDEDDPHDRRKSQVLMMAKLDEIERNLAQFSPRRLAIEDLAVETPTGMPSIASTLTPPAWRGSATSGTTSNPSPEPGPPTEGASWPAVPYSALSKMDNGPADPESAADDVLSPPRIAFNGISTELPKSPFQKRIRGDVISDETLARKRELEEEQNVLYPPLVAPQLLRQSASDSPVIPLSPDPFGRFPSDLDSVPPMEEELSSGRGRHAHNNKSSSGMSDAPSSRFSLDSVGSDGGATSGVITSTTKGAKPTSLMSVKSIKKLWRRTNKSSISGAPSPSLPESGRSSPSSAPAVGKRSSRTFSRSPQPDQLTQPPQSAPLLKPKRKTSLHSFHFNQETPYPVHPMPARQPSPAVPPVPATTPPLPASAPPVSMQNGDKGTRKSILKSFKSQSGSLSAHSSTSSIVQTPRSSSEMSQDQRRRKGSVVELSSVMKRASGVSSSMTLIDIPRSPALPEHLVNCQSRSNSRQSQLSNASERMSAAPVRQRPSISSTDSSSSRAPSRLMAGASPSRNDSALGVPRTSGDSYESRPSFDESQFEIVSPKLAPSQTLSYPYHGLDHSMSSAE